MSNTGGLKPEEAKKLSLSVQRGEILAEEENALGQSGLAYIDLGESETRLDGLFSANELRAIAGAMDRAAEKMKNVTWKGE